MSLWQRGESVAMERRSIFRAPRSAQQEHSCNYHQALQANPPHERPRQRTNTSSTRKYSEVYRPNQFMDMSTSPRSTHTLLATAENTQPVSRPHRRSRRKSGRRFHEHPRHRFQAVRHPTAPRFSVATTPATTVTITAASVPSPRPQRQSHLRSVGPPPVGSPRQRRQCLGLAVSNPGPFPPRRKRLRYETLGRLGDAGESARSEPRRGEGFSSPAAEDFMQPPPSGPFRGRHRPGGGGGVRTNARG